MPLQFKTNPFSQWMTGAELEEWAKAMELPVTDDKPEFAWVDVESTGLDPEKDVTLEVGILLTNGIGEICVNGACTWLVWREEKFESIMDKSWLRAKSTADPFVKEMHEKSGLWDDLVRANKKNGGTSRFLHPQVIEQDTRDWLITMCGEDVKLQLSGSTPHFDRGFLRRDLPKLEDWFHYRSGVDVSGIREVAKRVNPVVIATQPKKMEVHRPMPDLADSVKLYRHLLRSFLFVTDEIREKLG